MKKVYLVAVAVAIIAGVCTFLFATQLFKTVSAKSADQTTVIVPVQDVPANTLITAANMSEYFTSATVFNADVIENAVVDEETLLSKVTSDTLYSGEQINKNRLIDQLTDNVSLSLRLEPGYVAYTIVASGDQGVDGYIEEGDTVDLLYTTVEKEDENEVSIDKNGNLVTKDDKDKDDDEEEEEFADVTLGTIPALEVLKVSDHQSNSAAEESGTSVNTYSNITLKLSEADAEKLFRMESSETVGGYKLVLKNKASE